MRISFSFSVLATLLQASPLGAVSVTKDAISGRMEAGLVAAGMLTERVTARQSWLADRHPDAYKAQREFGPGEQAARSAPLIPPLVEAVEQLVARPKGAAGWPASEGTETAARAGADVDEKDWLPGRSADWRVARIGFKLATAAVARCPSQSSAPGLALQHLSQFQPADRPALIQAYALDKGAGVVAIVPKGPAARAGLRPGDVLLAVDMLPIPLDLAATGPFSANNARSHADIVYDLLDRVHEEPIRLTVLRAGQTFQTMIAPVPACPSRLHLARSVQRNAYADGRHVFVTTELLDVAHSDDELAFILAHEMAHNILGHAAMMRGGDVRRGLGRTFGKSGRIVRAAEEAADALAGEMMLDAGYDPVAGAAVLKRLGGGDLGIALFADHASAGRRIAAMRAIVERRRGS